MALKQLISTYFQLGIFTYKTHLSSIQLT